MAVVNQQLEDDNNHESGGSTSSIYQIGRVNASKEAEMKRVMIRLYKETMISADQLEDDNNQGSEGSTSSVDELAMVNASTEAEKELMNRIYKETICPMIYAEINNKQQKFISVIRDKFGLDLLTGMTWKFGNTASTSGSQNTKLEFLNGISTPVSTGNDIKGKDGKPFVLALIDVISREIVSSGPRATMEVEIVVLEGDCSNDETETWNSNEFNDKIVSEWNGTKVLQGNTFVKIKEGFVILDKISFTHNSAWKGNRNCRLGARVVKSGFPDSVKEGKTESFRVKDKRNFMYNKHPIPSLSDYVYRLYMISNRGDCFKRLFKEKVKTVMDLLTLNAINPERLKEILDVHPNTWKVIMDHAHKCKDDKSKGIYLYHLPNPNDGQKSNGVVFGISGNLVGLIRESQFVPCDKIPDDKKADAQKLIVISSEHWKEVISFNDLRSLINHLKRCTTKNSLCNNLNVVTPNTINRHDHTILTSPQVTTPIFPIENIGQSQSQSHSPKRHASDHTISKCPKKPRYGHSQMSPSTPSIGSCSGEVSDGNDWLQYIDFSQFDAPPAQNWNVVCRVIGWISVLLQLRKRRMRFCDHDTLIVISTSIQHS